MLQHKILVGTLHKTGTVLMHSIWAQFCREQGLVFWVKSRDRDSPPEGWQICFHDHSDLDAELRAGGCRAVFIIRDPRDVIISGAHYHTNSTEKWLHKPRPGLGGLTYQQKISSLPNDEERYLFEMARAGGATIRSMLSLVGNLGPESYVARLENLTTDYDLMEYHRIFSFLGFRGDAIPSLLSIAYRRSIFSGRIPPSLHVRSGKPAQWKTHFTPRVLRAFMQEFPDAPERLGYEPSSEAALVGSAAAV